MDVAGDVDAVAAIKDVIAAVAFQRVVACTAPQGVVVAVADEHVIVRGADQAFDAGVNIALGLTRDAPSTYIGDDRFFGVGVANEVVSIAAVEGVGADGAL